jgi:hypothetical protein
VRDIEEPSRCPHGTVFLKDSRVLNRHLPASELHELATSRQVSIVKRGATNGSVLGHGIELAEKGF